VRVDARVVEQVERGLAVLAGDVEPPAGRLVPRADAVEVERAAVAQQHDVGAARRVVRDVELVALRVAAEVGQRVEDEDPRVRAEAVAVELRRGEAARPGADDHAVVVVVAVDRPARGMDAGTAARAVHPVRVRQAVDPDRVAHDPVAVAAQPGRGRRVVAGRERRRLAPERGGELRLRAGEVRGGRGGGQPGRRDRHPVEEVPSCDAVALPLSHALSSPIDRGLSRTLLGKAPPVKCGLLLPDGN
jgi:hypothetical protein